MPKISIVVPVYNMGKYLEECIKSVQEQDYEDYEIIIIDDGSTDNSYALAVSLSNEEKRIKVIHKENEGVSIARNVGIEQANGEWIMFVDPDDSLQMSLISTLFMMASDGIDIVACCCNVFSSTINDEDYFFASNKTFSTFEEKKELYKQLMNAHYGQPGIVYTAIGVPWGKLYRRKFLINNQLCFNPQLKRYQDNIFNMYAFSYARSIVYLNQPLYNYRLDHIRQYGVAYKPGYVDYMGGLCGERYKCMRDLGLFTDTELNEFYQIEMSNRLWDILKNGIFIDEKPGTFIEKTEEAKIICKKECFQSLFTDPCKKFDVKDKVKLWLEKNEHFLLIGIFFSFKRHLDRFYKHGTNK